MSSQVRLFLLGTPQAERDGTRVGKLQPLATAICGYLAAQRQHVLRTQVAELFWPGKQSGRANLSWQLANIDNHLKGVIQRDYTTVGLLPSETLWLDLAEFEELTARDDGPSLEQAASLYRGPFLDGITVDNSPEVEQWLETQRTYWRQRVLAILVRAFDRYEKLGQHADALRVALRLLAIDPWHEVMKRHELRLLAELGQRHTALERYRYFRDQLRSEMESEPSAETQRLYESLLTNRIAVRPTDDRAVRNPYKGLRPFEEEDAGDFFGRDGLIEHLLDRLRLPGKSPHFLAIAGPSGSGKSSVVKAGLLPRLRAGAVPGSQGWCIVPMQPGSDPLAELEAALWRSTDNPPPGWHEALEREDGLLNAAELLVPSNGRPRTLLLFVDQFEELFTHPQQPGESEHFLTLLDVAARARDDRLWVLITVRADFFDRLLRLPTLAPLLQSQTEFVVPLTPDELREAIFKPAERTQLTFDPELLGTIVQEGRQRGSLPLIQYALTELAEQREGRTLTVAVYRASGGVAGALSQRADTLYEGLAEGQRTLARQLFLRLITPREGEEDILRRVTRRELEALAPDPDSVREVLDAYAHHRLLTFDRDPASREPTVELAHDALLRQWPRLRGWLDESRALLGLQRQLHSATEEWQRADHEASFLARGARLAGFEALLAENAVTLTAEERRYLETSLTRREEQARLDAERVENELENARALAVSEAQRANSEAQQASIERDARKRLRGLTTALILALLLAVGAALLAFSQQQEAQAERAVAERQAQLALARQLGAQAVQSMSGPVDLALLLSLESMRFSGEPQDRTRLLTGMALDPRLAGFLHQRPVPIFSVVFNEQGQLVTSDEQGGVTVWDLATREAVAHLSEKGEQQGGVAVSPDGQRAITSFRNSFTLWDAPSQVKIATYTHDSDVGIIDFSGDSRRFMTASGDGTFILWDAERGRELKRWTQEEGLRGLRDLNQDGSWMVLDTVEEGLPSAIVWDVGASEPLSEPLVGHTADIHSFAFSPNDTLLATAGIDSTVRLWDPRSGKQVGETLRGHEGRVLFVTFSPDGHWLLTSGTDGRVLLWDVATGQPAGPALTGHNNWVRGGAFSPDSTMLATADVDGKIILWNLATRRLLEGHTARVRTVSVSPDGSVLATTAFDSTIRTWDAITGDALQEIPTPHEGSIIQSGFSPDGRTFVTMDSQGKVVFWEPTAWTPRFPPSTEAHSEVVIGLAFSPDSRVLATGDFAGLIALWDVESGTLLHGPVQAHEGWVLSLAFSPDGALLASGSTDGTLAFWEAATMAPLGEPWEAHGNWVTALLFTPDGSRLLSASADQTIRRWEVATRQAGGEPLRGHDAQVWDLAFMPTSDGQTLVSLGGDGSVVWWDWQRGAPLAPPLLTGTETEDMVLSPDATRLYLGTFDTTAQLWQVDGRPWEERACSLVNRNLSEEEWQTYLHEVPYVPTCEGQSPPPTVAPQTP